MFGHQLQGVTPRSWLVWIDCPVPVWIGPSCGSDVKGRRLLNHADSIFVFCSLTDHSEEEANMSRGDFGRRESSRRQEVRPCGSASLRSRALQPERPYWSVVMSHGVSHNLRRSSSGESCLRSRFCLYIRRSASAKSCSASEPSPG